MGYRGIGPLHYHMDIPSNDLCCLDVRCIERLVILLLLYLQPRLSYLTPMQKAKVTNRGLGVEGVVRPAVAIVMTQLLEAKKKQAHLSVALPF